MNGSNNDQPPQISRERARALADKMRQRRESAALVQQQLGSNRPVKHRVGGGAPNVELEGCDDSQWGQPKPSNQILALVEALKNGSMSSQELAIRFQQAMACPIEGPSGTYKDVLGFETSTAPTGTANATAGFMEIQVDETFQMKRLIISDEFVVGVTITDIKVANRNQFTNTSNVANSGYSAGVFSALNPCPIEFDFPACPGGLFIRVEYFNNSGAALVLQGTGYGTAYGC
jgi:hypothetical protein